jgi:hypothetical protein
MTRSLLLLTVAGLAVRIAFLLLEPTHSLAGDEHTWTTWGAEVLAGSEVAFSPLKLRLIFYPPVYPYFIGVTYAVFGSLTAVKVCQACVSVLLIPAAGRLGERVFGPRAGLATAATLAFYPDLVWFSVHFWSETVFMVLLWWAFERLSLADERSRTHVAAGAGVLWGLAVLTRETPLYFTPLVAAWLALRPDRGRARAAAFLLTALLTVAPWTYRNWVVYRGFVPVSTAGALNLWQGNAQLSRQEVYDRYAKIRGRIEKYRYATRMGIEAILERQPAWLVEKLAAEMPAFWEADSLALVHIKRGAYGDVHIVTGILTAVIVLVPYLTALVLFVAGVASTPFDRRRLLLLAFLAYYTLLHVATHGFARYRLPVMPVVFLFAAWWWTAWRAGELPALGRGRKALAAALGLALGASVTPSLTSDWAEPSYQGSDEGQGGEP